MYSSIPTKINLKDRICSKKINLKDPAYLLYEFQFINLNSNYLDNELNELADDLIQTKYNKIFKILE